MSPKFLKTISVKTTAVFLSTLIAGLSLSFGFGANTALAVPAYVWTERTGSGQQVWTDFAMSDDGTKIAATPDSDHIYTSTDGGVTWTARTNSGQRFWIAITSSSDGTKLAAVEFGGYIYTSTDSGATWTARTGPGQLGWLDIASSADGTRLIAAAAYDNSVFDPNYLYTSDDGGATWTQRTSAGQRNWFVVASSDDGKNLIAGGDETYLYISYDYGETWTENTTLGLQNWNALASTPNGIELVAASSVGHIYTSDDSGSRWTERASAGERTWEGLAISSDGTKIAAVSYFDPDLFEDDYIYVSNDSGENWVAQTSAGRGSWMSLDGSADGTKLIAAMGESAGYVYTGLEIDTYPPEISEINVDPISSTEATVNWVTDEPATSLVTYGLTPSYGSSETGDFGTSHSVLLTGLTPQTTYNYAVSSTDSNGNAETSSNRTFTTEAAGSDNNDNNVGDRSGGSRRSGGRVCRDTGSNTFESTNDFTFTRELKTCLSGSDVLTVQNFLIANGFLAAGNNTGYFGPITESAVAQFQSANSISPANGVVNAITRLNMYLEFVRSQSTSQNRNQTNIQVPTGTPGAPAKKFLRNLKLGSSGADVKALQQFLVNSGYLDIPRTTTYFGPKTKAALARYQAEHTIYPATGSFGPKTRTFLNNLPR